MQQLKTAAITIWVSLIGWAFASKIDVLVPLGYVIIFGFWLLEAMLRNKTLENKIL
ncbi:MULTISPECIES: hypothetical protein [unclassified Microcoleus]|uniref:hypothetical protein n=1 Tax=unclassified Microcoleus TaxID=2642155 RepID=UPI001D55743C|nr:MULTISPECIES: hypothetical protein [unclassified Microcoleus]MCC3600097.1 hypothetical protein [Microcoleus sp. PH2017_26_ELK_O_A]MCC3625047.1 hypothetical protein [Microcoleus sp. PH2017_36_ELK_O_B]